ncbi:MAG: DMT family transporter [Pegethrix bostrychoides GSE-TBD4-15B]|jgi:drug/metabolite transporter (DMT)-like permease|uniref:DMT family transporter n=1 Tax=Pegethrix bostrychoides GSE-TBD4-15B TaxID=2839662 RepID=A0A951PCE3_9CYAN|nr:DMT family transporter [Pegethrix bostrychoides GSE-TBD4-15B]
MLSLWRNRSLHPETLGLFYGFLGVLSFSFTLPATRLAVSGLDPTFVGLGRGLVAGSISACLLLLTRQAWPTQRQWRSLAVVALGVVLGFPLLSAWAMQRLPAAHGAVVLGLLPLLTAVAGVLRAGERPAKLFWLASGLGSATVVSFAASSGSGTAGFYAADLVLLGAVLAAAIGYAEGGKLAQEIGGWQVICWALVLSVPFVALPTLLAAQHNQPSPGIAAWFGFGYLCLVSQLVGFFAWYHGLAIGGVARVSQMQLLQPFLTLIFAMLVLREVITPMTLAAAALVIASVAIGRKAKIRRSQPG